MVAEVWGFACCPECGHAWLAFICLLHVTWLPSPKETAKCVTWCMRCQDHTAPDVQCIELDAEEAALWTEALRRREFVLSIDR